MDIINWENEKDFLYDEVVNKNTSYEALGRHYNCSGNTIKKILKALEIPTKQRRKINPIETFNKGKHQEPKKCLNCGKDLPLTYDKRRKFCSNKCQQEFQSREKYLAFLQRDPKAFVDKEENLRWLKKWILEEQDHKCAICGLKDEWMGKPLVFVLDHEDGRAFHNTRENLRLICPNCDSQLDTYKSKNKNSDRIYHHFHHR